MKQALLLVWSWRGQVPCTILLEHNNRRKHLPFVMDYAYQSQNAGFQPTGDVWGYHRTGTDARCCGCAYEALVSRLTVEATHEWSSGTAEHSYVGAIECLQ